MSLQQDCWLEEIPEETAQLGEQLLKANNLYRFVGENINPLLQLSDFVSMYSELGRGAICPLILSLVTIFQYLENIPDREAAQWAVLRLDWKYALHVPLSWLGFHFSSLSNFRQRLLEHEAERLLFDRVLAWVQQAGYLKKKGKQRTDSTHIIGQVAHLSRLELVWETLRLALGEMKGAAPTWYGANIPAAYVESYQKRQHDWQVSKEEVAQHLQQAGQDGYWLLKQLDETVPTQLLTLPAVTTLREVWSQQFVWVEGQAQAQTKVKGKEIIVSPHETEARWSRKRSTEWEGYKMHITETVEREDGVTFITDVATTTANTGDSEVVDEIQERLQERDLLPDDQYVDQGYVSGPNLAHSHDRGVNLMGPAPLDVGHKPEGYRQADFTLNFIDKTATCPEGNQAVKWFDWPQEDGYVGAKISFGAHCATCPARALCAPGQKGRTLEVSPYLPFLQARREEQQTEAFHEQMKQRAAIEGTISSTVRKHGARRTRYRGQAKTRLQHLFSGAAVNLKRLTVALGNQMNAPLPTQRVQIALSCS
jgi:transposase